MKKIFFIFSAFAFIILFWAPQGSCQSARAAEKEQIFGRYLDQFVTKCESKAEMQNSKCINIRREAALSCLKAHFFEFHREDLIKSMIAENIGTKPYQIHYYLTARFFDRLRKATKAVHSLRAAVRRANE